MWDHPWKGECSRAWGPQHRDSCESLILLEPFNPANLLTWITRLTVAADQATPTNRFADLPKGNLY